MAFNETIASLGGNGTLLGQSAHVVYDFGIAVKPLFLFTIAIVIYCLFIFNFYSYLAKRDILVSDEDDDDVFRSFLGMIGEATSHSFQSLILVPLLVFFWFAVLAGLLMLLSKTHTPETLMLTALSIVAAVRVTSYYNEELSHDLAKLIPLALIAVFATDLSAFSVERSLDLARQLPDYSTQLFNYLVFVVLLEFVMRIIEFFVKKHKQMRERRRQRLLQGS